MADRYLILSASMGAGHHGVAAELGQRLRARGDAAEVVDLLELLPVGLGPALRGGYQRMLAHAPWLYTAIYRGFFELDALSASGPAPSPLSTGVVSDRPSAAKSRDNGYRGGPPAGRGERAGGGGRAAGPRPSTSPVVLAALPRLRALLADQRPDAVISTFHLCAQALGRLRQRGELAAPSVVVLTDFALNRVWLHPGTDLFLAPTATIAAEVTRRTGGRALAPGPVVSDRFHQIRAASHEPGQEPGGEPAGAPAPAATGEDDRLNVLVAGGAWGVGAAVERVARVLAASGHYRPVVLCGRNADLLRRLDGRPGVRAVGWTDQVPRLMAEAAALVENAGGVTATEAFAAGVPVVTHRPIPGHGRDSAVRLAAAGLTSLSRDDGGLLAALDALCRPGPRRDAQTRAAAALFTADPARLIASFVAEGTDVARQTR